MPILQGVQNSNFFNNIFTDIAGDQYNGEILRGAGIAKLLDFSAVEAFYDSAERSSPPRCHPGTREDILSQIMGWVGNADRTSQRTVLWLHGPMGAGKSAISQSISETARVGELLAATFFFSRGHPRRGNLKFLINTIAYQLSLSFPDLRDILDTIITDDPSILQKSITKQLQKLIVEPFKRLAQTSPAVSRDKKLLVIDGLDECDGDKNQCTILEHISNLVTKHQLPLVFLVTSRRAPHIEQSFRHGGLSTISNQLHLKPSDDEVLTFLESGFSAIRTRAGISEFWPTPSQMKKLVHRSSGYFIYATTVLKFLDDPDRHPDEQLAHILHGEPAPFAELDDLYHEILSTVADKALLSRILQTLVACRLSPWGVGRHLGHRCETVKLTLRRMAPLLDVSGDHDPIDFIHASFIDFLCDRRRACTSYINKPLAKKRFDHYLFQIEMMHELTVAYETQLPLLPLLFLWWWFTTGPSQSDAYTIVILFTTLIQPPFRQVIMYVLTAEPIKLPDALLQYSTLLPSTFSFIYSIDISISTFDHRNQWHSGLVMCLFNLTISRILFLILPAPASFPPLPVCALLHSISFLPYQFSLRPRLTPPPLLPLPLPFPLPISLLPFLYTPLFFPLLFSPLTLPPLLLFLPLLLLSLLILLPFVPSIIPSLPLYLLYILLDVPIIMYGC